MARERNSDVFNSFVCSRKGGLETFGCGSQVGVLVAHGSNNHDGTMKSLAHQMQLASVHIVCACVVLCLAHC